MDLIVFVILVLLCLALDRPGPDEPSTQLDHPGPGHLGGRPADHSSSGARLTPKVG